jgi:hypothetical protein
LSGYAIVNLLEIEDSAAGRVPGMEGRFSRTLLDSRDLGVSHHAVRDSLGRSRGLLSYRLVGASSPVR